MLESGEINGRPRRNGAAQGSAAMEKKLPQEDDGSKAAGGKPQKADMVEKKGQAEPKRPGRVNTFFRRTTRLLLTSGLLFAAGLLTAYFAFQRPQAAEQSDRIAQLTTEKSDLETQVAALQEEIQALEPLETENSALEVSLADEVLHVRVLSALNDVLSAQLNLALAEVDAARLSLGRTEEKLVEVQELLPADQQGVVDGMIQRLNLVLDGMESDAFAAQSDLEVLANSLLQLENTLFGSP
jgi:Tfp pilus assembly protein PilN